MTEAEAIELAKAHAEKWGVPWSKILQTEKHKRYWIAIEGYTFTVDTGNGSAIAVIDVEQAHIYRFEFYPNKNNDWMLPPWAAFPQFTSVTINWRMGDGEQYWTKWHDWFQKLPLKTSEAYRRHFSPPDDPNLAWSGFYERIYGETWEPSKLRMTEQEWHGSTDPGTMLGFLRGEASDRKMRLFACACCRNIWHLLVDKRSREAVESAERLADGNIDLGKVNAAQETARQAFEASQSPGDPESAARNTIANNPFTPDRAMAASDNASWAVYEVTKQTTVVPLLQSLWRLLRGHNTVSASDKELTEKTYQSVILRCIFGNPFRPITLDPTWLTSTMKSLAQKVYDDRTFDQLLLLADELVKSGCDNQEILGHCRGSGPHVRGCWVVDGVLGKK